MSLADIRAQHIRGALLGLLKDRGWYNDSLLHTAVNNVKFVDAGREEVRDAIRWLAGQRMVEMQELEKAPGEPPMLRARIAQRGIDFEAGDIFVEGIHRPVKL